MKKMRLPEHIGLEPIIGAVRKPLATVATIATLAAGVALETPAPAGAQPKPDVPTASSPREQPKRDAETMPSIVAGGMLVGAWAVGLWGIARSMHRSDGRP